MHEAMMTRSTGILVRWLIATWLCMASALHTGTASAQIKGLELPELQTWQLDNGMKVAFLRSDAAPVVAVEVWYHVGSKDEARNRRGSAHMFEHMMFKGSERVAPEEHARYLNRLGGYVNAGTTEDATFYVNVLPSDYLDFACQLESERMRKLLFRPEMIATEREVVKEEIRQSENNPLAKGFLRFLEIAYKKHPYAWTAGGAAADLDATTPAELERFYNTYYVPQNAMLVVVGNVTKEQVEKSAKAWFGPIARGAEPPRPADASPEPPQAEKRREVVEPGQIGLVLGGFHIPEAKHEDIYALQVASTLLGVGESSRLHRRLVRTDKVAIQVGAPILVREHPGLLAVFAAYLDPAQGAKAEAALLAEVTRLQRAPVLPRELIKAKNQMVSGFVFGLESASGLAQQIGMSWIQTGDPGSWLRSLQKYEAVTAADIQRVAKKYLNESNLTIVVIPPRGAGPR